MPRLVLVWLCKEQGKDIKRMAKSLQIRRVRDHTIWQCSDPREACIAAWLSLALVDSGMG